MMSGALPGSQAPLAPDYACQLFDQVLLRRSPWLMLGEKRFEQCLVLLAVLPRRTVCCDKIPCRSAFEAGNFIVGQN
jgi:hypothetical protein